MAGWRPSAVLFALALLVGCGSSASQDSDLLAVEQTTPFDDLEYSMAALVLEKMNLPPQSAVITPTNRGILAADADKLADMVQDDGLRATLERSSVRTGFDAENMERAILVTESADVFQMQQVDGQWYLGDLPYVGLVDLDGVHLILVDGLPEVNE